MSQTERIEVATTFADDGTMQLRLSDRGGHGYVDVRVLEDEVHRVEGYYRVKMQQLSEDDPDMTVEQRRDAALWWVFDTFAPPFEETNQ